MKHYSSGMQLRLGFAVATGVAPDVLVVDEALAVGDARFQLRCLERMRELVRAGTTVLYVSHDLATVCAGGRYCSWTARWPILGPQKKRWPVTCVGSTVPAQRKRYSGRGIRYESLFRPAWMPSVTLDHCWE